MKQFRKRGSIISMFISLNLVLASCSNSINDALDSTNDGPNKIEMTSNGILSKNIQEYSGEDLFKSIFFGYGEFAKKISMFQETIKKIEAAPVEQHEIFLERFNTFANSVKKNNPQYFENFKKDIISGDNSNIQNAIKYGSISIYENVNILAPELTPIITQLEQDEEIESLVNGNQEVTQEDIDGLKIKYDQFLDNNYDVEPQACSWAAACVIYVAFGFHNTIGFNVNIAVTAAAAIYLAIKFWGPKLDSPKKTKSISLSEDVLRLEMFVQDIADASAN